MPWLVPCLSEVSTSNPLTPSSKPPARSSPATSPGCPTGKPEMGWDGSLRWSRGSPPPIGSSARRRLGRDRDPAQLLAVRPAPGVRAEDITFANLGYADERDRLICALRRRSGPRHLADDMRFQVSLPTAYMALMAYIELEHRDALTPAYKRALGREVSRIVDSIPAHRLAIQWDCPCEVGITEQVGPPNTWTLDDVAADSAGWRRCCPPRSSWAITIATAIRPMKRAGTASTGWSPTTRARWCASQCHARPHHATRRLGAHAGAHRALRRRLL